MTDRTKRTCAIWHPRIEAAIRSSQKKAAKAKRPFKLNLAELARDLGTSRPTIYKHERFIERVLQKLDAERRRVDGHAGLEFLKDQLKRKDDEIAILTARNETLMRDLQTVYDHIYGASLTAAELVDAVVRDRTDADGQCILCGSEVKSLPEKKTNVVPLPPKGRR
ncbi:hypothetical protein NHN26_10740 [Rhodovulum tesquicola]|uniref:hypothetical protein n=1 Tax=Rhodovulum tesquicola TaxID=540254 RepID=UPI0020970E56|nr:hypothetical protein [Rhodovulum tesquicola]MCO8145703.1 hypothetical protein [Rhodovulum tesquicola]